MDRLSILLTLMTGAVLTGALTVLLFTFGAYAWWAVLLAVILGWGAAWPLGYVIATRIKRRDPHWRRADPKERETRIGVDAPEI